MWGWLIALAVVVGLAMLPLGVSAKFDSAGPLVRIIAGPVRLKLFPAAKRERKQKAADTKEFSSTVQPKKENQGSKKSEPQKDEKPKEDKGGKLTDFLPLVQVALDFLGDFRRKLRVDRLELKLILAGEDPCDLAVNYGRTWAAVGNLFPLLERIFVIKKRDVEVECDFTAEDTAVIARLDLTITLGRILTLALRYGIRGLKEYLNIKKLRKGGALK